MQPFLFFSIVLLIWRPLYVSSTESTDSEDDENIRPRDHIEQLLLGEIQVEDSPETENERTVVNRQQFHQREETVLQQLRNIYHKKIRPVEKQFHYGDLKRHVLTDADIYAKPIVLLVGPWSTGKSTIINYILGIEKNIQSLHVGAEPTTADFTIITYGEEYRSVEGVVLATDITKPFSSMEKFGQIFLEHLLGIEMPKPLLRNLTFIDTPGILENRRQQERGYPYKEVLRWLVQRADLIFVVFDPTKLDVGSELESLFLQLKGKESVLRIILNKADSMNEQELMRVYGALYWSLAPLINVTEPPRIYVGSFWSRNFQSSELYELLLREEKSLLKDMREVIRNQVQNKIAFIRQQAIKVRIHALLVDSYVAAYRRNKGFFNGGDELAYEIAENTDHFNVYRTMLSHPNVSEYDLPDPEEYKEFFRINQMYEMRRVTDYCGSWSGGCSLDELNHAIGHELPQLLQQFQKEMEESSQQLKTETECDDKSEACFSHTQRTDQWAKTQWTKAKRYSSHQKPEQTKESMKWKTKKVTKSTTSNQKGKHKSNTRNNNNNNQKILAEAQQTERKKHKAANELMENEINDPSVTEPGEAVQHKAEKQKPVPIPTQKLNDYEMKLKCLFRKSCYKTGILPNLSQQMRTEAAENSQPIEQSEYSKKLKCKFRKSCTEPLSKVLPSQNKQAEKRKYPKFKEEKGQKEKGCKTEVKEKIKATAPSQADYMAKKQICKWRKSCYTTGTVPKLKEKYSDSAKDNITESTLTQTTSSKTVTELCKWRKSCYASRKSLDLEQKTNESKIANQEKTENDQQVPCRLGHSCLESNEKQVDKIEIPAEHDEENVTNMSATEDHQRMLKKGKDNLHTERDSQTKQKKLKVSDHKKDKETELSKASPPLKPNKVSCRWRKSCYSTGILPDLNIHTSSPTDKVKLDIEAYSDTKTIQQKCKWRKTCYDSDFIPAVSMKRETVEEKSDSVIPTANESKGEPAEYQKRMNEKCKWRKSCYETGRIPDISGIKLEAPETAAVAATTTTTSLHTVEAMTLQEKCKWRKNCYEKIKTGSLASETVVVTEIPAPKPVTPKLAEGPTAHPEKLQDKKKSCHWRKSCYETGSQPHFIVKQASESGTKQVCNKYRKSCKNESQKLSEVPTPPLEKDVASSQAQHVATDSQDQKCNKYRKSCHQNTAPSTRSIFSSAAPVNWDENKINEKPLKNNSIKCNRWRISCRELLGMPPKLPKGIKAERPKKLCRKQKPGENSKHKTTKWAENSTKLKQNSREDQLIFNSEKPEIR